MERFVNLPLLANPLNWLTVLLMLLIAGYAATLLAPSLAPSLSDSDDNA